VREEDEDEDEDEEKEEEEERLYLLSKAHEAIASEAGVASFQEASRLSSCSCSQGVFTLGECSEANKCTVMCPMGGNYLGRPIKTKITSGGGELFGRANISYPNSSPGGNH